MMERSSFSWKGRRLFKKLKKLKNDERAVVMIMFAIMFAAMLAFLGLLFDGGRMYFEKRRMQVAADAGARGGALDLRRFGTGSSFIVSGGRDDAALNSFEHGTAGVDVTINNPPASGNFGGNSDCVAIVSKAFPTTLMRIASATGYTVGTRAVACVGAQDQPDCITSLYCGTTETGLRFNGNASVTVTDCNVAVNSQNDPSILFNGGGNCTSGGGEAIILAGDDPGFVGYSGATTGTLVNNGSNYCIGCDEFAAESCDPEAIDDMIYAPDPYCENLRQTECDQGVPNYPVGYPSLCETTNEDGQSDIPFPDPDPAAPPPAPDYMGPEFNIGLINGQDTNIASVEFPDCEDAGVGPASSPTQPCVDLIGPGAPLLQLPAGYYTGPQGIRMNIGTTVNLQCNSTLVGGCLFITDNFEINGGTLTGTNVTVYTTNALETGTANEKAINIGAGAEVTLSAPIDGLYQNLLLFNSRWGTMGCFVGGNANSVFVGAIYCATGLLQYGGVTTTDASGTYAALIGYQIEFFGNPTVNVNFTGGGVNGRGSQFSEVTLVE